MTPRPLTITGGKLVLPAGAPQPGALRCEEGRIVALGEITPEDGDEVIEARGALIAPGLVDFGVFAIDKPAFHFGGITRAALMPDQGPPLDHPARVRFAAPRPLAGVTIREGVKAHIEMLAGIRRHFETSGV